MLKSRIIITNDYESLKDELIAKLGINNLRFFEKESFLLDDAKEALSEAYIAESRAKFIILRALSFGNEAQNALLTTIEEPPANIYFILSAPYKNCFLPTIISRLSLSVQNKVVESVPTGIDFKKFDLKQAYEKMSELESLEKNGEFGKNELKSFISKCLKEALQSGINLNEKELENIKKLMVLADLNTKINGILPTLFLMLIRH